MKIQIKNSRKCYNLCGDDTMKLLFKQRFFSWFDSYDIYDESGQIIYQVEGRLSWGHKLVIYDQNGNEVGNVLEKVMTLLPKFEIYKNNEYIGCLSKELSFFTPHYHIDYNGWHIVFGSDYCRIIANLYEACVVVRLYPFFEGGYLPSLACSIEYAVQFFDAFIECYYYCFVCCFHIL